MSSTRQQQIYQFDTFAIFQHCGGARGVHELLSRAHKPPELAAVRAWLKRRSIPTSWLPTVLWLLYTKHGINPTRLILPAYRVKKTVALKELF